MALSLWTWQSGVNHISHLWVTVKHFEKTDLLLGWRSWYPRKYLGGGFKYFLCSPRKLGKMNPFWRAYFSKGWFNHQLDMYDFWRSEESTPFPPGKAMNHRYGVFIIRRPGSSSQLRFSCISINLIYPEKQPGLTVCLKERVPSLKLTFSPLKIGNPKRKVVFQPSIFRGELLVSGRVLSYVFQVARFFWFQHQPLRLAPPNRILPSVRVFIFTVVF